MWTKILDIWAYEQCNKILLIEAYNGLDNTRVEVQQEYEKWIWVNSY